ncbi:WbqC family protein [Nitrobacter sp.]|uniref:WbqC family protein n=1 Tax=Nitrobacter sp. TaxID=29420 RepID=UPI0029CAAD1B|nr:WbqC family protein [Nitrobacter sp.]
MKKVAILQSNYIPWKGYFDLIAAVDEFIIYDDMQFTKNDWRNRNKLKTPTGSKWLTVPVGQNISRRIRDVEILSHGWQDKHWKSLIANYGRAPYFDFVTSWLMPLYLKERHSNLSAMNRQFLEVICKVLDINTRISNNWDYQLIEGKTERLVSICQQASAAEYISGPAARSYLDDILFASSGIKVTWFDYAGYPEYPQLWGPFEHGVSILDLLFNCGPDARKFMKR